MTVNFPSSINSIGSKAFYGCSGLQKDVFPNEMAYIGINYDSENSKVTYGNNSKIYIGTTEYNPEEIEWPQELTSIPAYAFYGITSLKSIKIPETVTEIGTGAFYGCSGLSNINLPESISDIMPLTFYGCRQLSNLKIPSSVISIGHSAFDGCYGLRTVNIDDIDRWSQIHFGDVYANPIYFAKSFNVGDINEPVKHLDLKLDNSGISNYAFYNAQNLETVRVVGSSIGLSAFFGCTKVKQICVDVDELSGNSFGNNKNLESVFSVNNIPPSAPDNTFSKYSGINLYVPEGSLNEYENAQECWWQFLDIYESDFSNLDEIFGSDINTGVEDIFYNVDDVVDKGETYTLNGIKITPAKDSIAPGIYIVRKGNKLKKIIVK